MIVWRLVDGRPGHENQTRGLVQALAARCPVEVRDLAAPAAWQAAAWWARSRFPPGEGLPDPDLILGAGHATHLPMLAARRARGGRTVVLMRPSLPARWFDLVVVPRHDDLTGPDVIRTLGALNPVRPGEKQAGTGLLLVGGPSRHVEWHSEAVLDQVREIVRAVPETRWRLVTSRRTPPGFAAAARALFPGSGLEVVEPHAVDADWLPAALAVAPVAWVTADSVSMLYESLSAGAATGLIEVPARGRSRLQQGVAELIREGRVVSFSAWRAGVPLQSGPPLAEADRVAGIIQARGWCS